ncbi:MAG: hypothetical protein P9M13_02545 [Candidatus Ancaeobacter aquaticus]|nr:hypothetical protein [Candidatus Ancaeobacter aquaticus]
MTENKIDYDDLKKRGFLQSRKEGCVTLRTRMDSGNYTAQQLEKLSYISKIYGNGYTHLTVRQGIEIPFIPIDKVSEIENIMEENGIYAGTSGPRLRATTACPGTNWCKRGLVNTFDLFDKIQKKGIECGMDLPHKFKIVVSGCPNGCTRPRGSEIGIHGQVDVASPEKKIGFAVYLGGCGGLSPREGIKLEKVYSEDEVLVVIEKVITFFKENAKSRQRLGHLIEEIGKDTFLEIIGEK